MRERGRGPLPDVRQTMDGLPLIFFLFAIKTRAIVKEDGSAVTRM